MTAYVALLRAINVGGDGKLPMKALKAACEAAGFARVSTYIASGNVVFDSALPAAGVKAAMLGLLEERFGLTDNHCMVRTPGEIEKVMAANPFMDAAESRPNLMLVGFLDGVAPAAAAEALRAYQGPERWHIDRDHIYLDYAGGVGASKLTPAYLTRALKVPFTARNWNTTGKLLAMARALEQPDAP